MSYLFLHPVRRITRHRRVVGGHHGDGDGSRRGVGVAIGGFSVNRVMSQPVIVGAGFALINAIAQKKLIITNTYYYMPIQAQHLPRTRLHQRHIPIAHVLP